MTTIEHGSCTVGEHNVGSGNGLHSNKQRRGVDYAALDQAMIPAGLNPDADLNVHLEVNVYERAEDSWVLYTGQSNR